MATSAWKKNPRRRGITMVLVMVSLPLLFGMAALTIDVGRMTNTRVELQNTADAAALAASQDLGSLDPFIAQQVAEATATEFIGLNPVWNNQPVSQYEIVFGRAELDPDTGGVAFIPNLFPANAVDVTVHYELQYFFARVFGMNSKLVSARSTSAIGARDVMFVLDTSCSMGALSDLAEVTDDLSALGISIGGGTEICHIPLGNPANAVTLSIAQPAVVNAHLAHGDTVGECPDENPDCDDFPDDSDSGDSGDNSDSGHGDSGHGGSGHGGGGHGGSGHGGGGHGDSGHGGGGHGGGGE